MFSDQDLLELESLRLGRFEDHFSHLFPPENFILTIDNSQNELVILAPTAQLVDEILEEATELKYFAWIILAVESVAIHFAGERVWEALTREIGVQCSPGTRPQPTMPATLERKAEQIELIPTEEDVCTIDQLVDQIVQRTGRNAESVRSTVEILCPKFLNFGGQRLVPVSVIDQFMMRWAESIASEISMALHSEALMAPAAPTAPKKAAAKPAAKSKPAAKRTPAKKPPQSKAKSPAEDAK